MKTLLLGMGNRILSDDAVGVRLAADLARQIGEMPELDVVAECSVGGLNLLDVLRGYDRAIVLDSIRTTAGVPGSWYRFDATVLQDTLHLTNIHDVNLATALELGRRLGVPLPAAREIHIFAVEIQDDVTFSECMTPALEQAYPKFAAQIIDAVGSLLAVGAREHGYRSDSRCARRVRRQCA